MESLTDITTDLAHKTWSGAKKGISFLGWFLPKGIYNKFDKIDARELKTEIINKTDFQGKQSAGLEHTIQKIESHKKDNGFATELVRWGITFLAPLIPMTYELEQVYIHPTQQTQEDPVKYFLAILCGYVTGTAIGIAAKHYFKKSCKKQIQEALTDTTYDGNCTECGKYAQEQDDDEKEYAEYLAHEQQYRDENSGGCTDQDLETIAARTKEDKNEPPQPKFNRIKKYFGALPKKIEEKDWKEFHKKFGEYKN